jgi:hypothetical protein
LRTDDGAETLAKDRVIFDAQYADRLRIMCHLALSKPGEVGADTRSVVLILADQ